MALELHRVAWFISGPKTEQVVFDETKIESTISEMAEREGYDEDDYTTTALLMLGYRGPIDTLPDGDLLEQVNKILKEHLP